MNYISLSDKDFYPLIDRTTKWMTQAEKLAYRVEHGIPSTIDEWIVNAKTHVEAPTANPHKRDPSGEFPLWQDSVECTLNVVCTKGLVGGAVQNPDKLTLTLHVRVPPTTAFLMHYWHSPTVIIDEYTGDPYGQLSPEWLRTVQTGCQFWQSRPLMLEMMKFFVRTIPHNRRISGRVYSWCSAMSTPVSGLLTWVPRWRDFDPISPRNTRNHKPRNHKPRNTRNHKARASNLSAEESRNLRKVLNEGSPLRRRKY